MKRREADPDWSKATISLADLAEFFQVSESAVMKWAREGGMPKGTEKGRYPLRECVRWLMAREKASAEDETKDIMEERRKLIVSQRQHQELENAKMREELVDVNVVTTAFQEVGALIATQLDALAPRLAPQVVQLRGDQAAIQRLIYDECRAVRANASRSVARWSGDFLTGENPQPTAKKKRRRVGRRAPDPAAGQSGAGAVAN